MDNEEAARERARIAQSDRERAAKERSTNSEKRASEEIARNTERKQQIEDGRTALQSGNVNLQEIAKQGGSLGRKLEREIRRFEQTGRVSSWLAGETLKAQSEQNAAQQSAFRQSVLDVVSSPQSPLPLLSISPFLDDLHEKPKVTDEQDFRCIGLGLFQKEGNVWINAGTINGQVPSGLDPLEGKFIAGSGSGQVWAEIEINETTGQIISTSIDNGNSTPSDTTTFFYNTLGVYNFNQSPVFTNFGCGSLSVTFCRNWFVVDPPYFTVTFTR